MTVSFDELREKNKKLKAKLFIQGKWKPGRNIRNKPRNPIKLEFFYQRAMDRLKKYPPRWINKNELILPYFYDPEKDDQDDPK